MKPKLDRIISIATLLAAVTAIVLVLKRPAPVAEHSAPAAVPVNTQAFEQKPAAGEQASQMSQAVPQASQPANVTTNSTVQQPAVAVPTQAAKSDPHSDAISAVLAQSLGAATSGLSNLSPDSNVGSSAPNIKDQQVTMDGDVVHGRFLTEIGGKDVWVTVSGHMGEKDGFATFDPTEFKVGDVDVPVSLVNPLLQKKLEEERDRLKVPGAQ
jgi:hypothetical protein